MIYQFPRTQPKGKRLFFGNLTRPIITKIIGDQYVK